MSVRMGVLIPLPVATIKVSRPRYCLTISKADGFELIYRVEYYFDRATAGRVAQQYQALGCETSVRP